MLQHELQKWFGFDSFKPGQQAIIEHVLNGKDTLGILPTGSGKSLCYQLPTYIKQKPTLIISPLISLMDDQVMQLKLHGEHYVSCIHSGLDENEKQQNMQLLKHSRFIFLSPEFLLQPHNFKLIQNLDLGLIVLDEAHCLSEWGYDFRPHYALVGKIIDHFPEANVLALTATAPPYLTSDLNQMLNKNFIIVKTTMNRENISLTHKNFEDDHAKLKWLLPLLEHSGPTIIYVSSKKMCLNLAKAIYQYGFLTGIYHGDLTYQERHTVQHQFINNEIPIIVATSAFGMGINKKDIRTIIHFHLTTSPSNYMQEIGRAGRDGAYSQAISLFQPDDSYLLETLLFADVITEEDVNTFELGMFLPPEKIEILEVLFSYYSIKQLRHIFATAFQRKKQGYHRMLGYKQLDQCRRAYMVEFFGEELSEKPNHCCDNDSELIDINIVNRKKVKRKMDYNEKLQNLFK
ncbi:MULTISPECIES: RecQ family ATP-dependent DNA helicase [Staphylococcus]|jgi:ATP-dependent DNA helicase RecQ|uniref:ATP-dependent DNA helicase RecQ n=1 Tax=Staphylococcus nepalensis TaxID=214473 RepID=A0A291JJW5_9STAP|nr:MULTISPECIES: ATP-dependent DNA helicase RecQ [Staphylococcus]VDG67052.1 ATP-dependent DNA helicase [Lacrimispora indolis]ATH60042.1 recombinase RecQ [Staphylococcus nepalensis]ATH65133.1 recombinase RecQ [Staphylococcus nepalensis]AWI44500.1 recombinase RecQ [Staphylococcus nepalensis]MBO1204995.1 ATP-dependent DNA helicase RecQ [Staphylococcus nepalensis]